ncbi:MAG: hypothetical protein AABY00_03695 [Nanoarchaeota archaeon]
MKKGEVVLVDDDLPYLGALANLVKRFHLEPIEFQKPSEAMNYLQSRAEMPAACFVDMKPYDVHLLKESTTEKDFPEIGIPEKIHALLQERGWLHHFYFITAHVSEYDAQVLARTKASCLEKDRVDEFKEKLSEIVRDNKL